MKRVISPLILFIGAFVATQLLQPYTFIFQEQDGLFLWSKDYFTLMFQQFFPLSGILGDFLTQFYRYLYIAPLILAIEAVLAYLLIKGILSRLGLGWDVLAAFFACGVWLAGAFAPTAKTAVLILLLLLPVFLLSRLLPKRKSLPMKDWAEWAGTAILVLGTGVFLSLSPRIASRERTSALRQAVVTSDWNRAIDIATPAAAKEDRDMLPLVLMAWGMKEQLGEHIFDYEIWSEDDLDMKGRGHSYACLFFRGFLYNNLVCPNEAAHNFFQLATLQGHGQSFMVLRQLVADYYVMGNFTLARKYLAILSRSSCHARFVRFYQNAMKEESPREADSLDYRKSITLVSQDPLKNLLTLDASGLRSRFLLDRILCTLLIREDYEQFQVVFQSVREAYYPVVPKYYW